MNRFRPAVGRQRTLHRSGYMNRTEAAYAEHLEARRLTGEILAWDFEVLKLKLAEGTYYTPDFLVQAADGVMECHEVKATWTRDGKPSPAWEDDARVKFKVAAERHPWLRFAVARKLSKAEGPGFQITYADWDAV